MTSGRENGSFPTPPSRKLERFPIILDRHCEERSDEAIQPLCSGSGLLRFARNDGVVSD